MLPPTSRRQRLDLRQPSVQSHPGAVVDVACGDDAIPPADLAALETLDDAIFDALKGDAAALDRSPHLWRKLKREAPRRLVDESREQYVRQAEHVCRIYREDPPSNLGRAFAALEILALMAD